MMETALPSRSSLVVVTAMLLAAVCATPVPTTPFAPRLAELHASFEIAIVRAQIAQLEHELDALQHQIDALQHKIDANTIRIE